MKNDFKPLTTENFIYQNFIHKYIELYSGLDDAAAFDKLEIKLQYNELLS